MRKRPARSRSLCMRWAGDVRRRRARTTNRGLFVRGPCMDETRERGYTRGVRDAMLKLGSSAGTLFATSKASQRGTPPTFSTPHTTAAQPREQRHRGRQVEAGPKPRDGLTKHHKHTLQKSTNVSIVATHFFERPAPSPLLRGTRADRLGLVARHGCTTR